ncbi:hypothetical protein ABH900_002070 [Stenotrophomonas sp. AN71]
MTATTWLADMRVLLAAALMAVTSAPSAHAANDVDSEPPQARLLARAYGLGTLGPRAAGDDVEVEIRLRGPAIRIDFRGSNAPDAWLTTQGQRGRAWLVSESGNYTLPVADASGPYWYDPAAPCQTIGGRCSPAPGEFILGRLAAGWRYDNAHGPDGTTSGTLWIDTRTGLLLGYRGRTGNRRSERGLRVTDVSFGDVPASLFDPPAGLRRRNQDQDAVN